MTLRTRLNAIARQIEQQIGPCPACLSPKIVAEDRRDGRVPADEDHDTHTTCDQCGKPRRLVRIVLE